MDLATFSRNLHYAQLLADDIAKGYIRGLRRHYHGSNFGTPEEHLTWMALGTGNDPRVDLGNGYRAGFEGKPFAEVLDENTD